ncbi:MAG: 2-succinyl-5-enolpyruvyl-6-hydroxy-3-cyclohexene-1-carboxylic-acid synthase, partial [Cyanobacteria bacterium J06649_4]
MSLDFRNTNSLWASVAVETLARLGLQTAILCPGSRSTPLTFAFATHSKIEALPILDERSAAFFALGCAKRQHRPVAIVCTSGTAGANFYPAIIEAYESGVPLLVFTADRPPELRDCAAGQAIDQQKLYGGFVKHYSELAVPIADEQMLAYLKQTLVSGWGRVIAPIPGPIHFNCPFRDPLPPLSDNTTHSLQATWNSAQFFSSVAPLSSTVEQTTVLPTTTWQNCSQGLIIAGPSYPENPQQYCQQISTLSQQLGWPVLAEGLSPLRNYQPLNELLISTYDGILRSAERANSLIPKMVIQLGTLPISKVLRQWLQTHQPQRWVVGSQRNLDPLHGPTQMLTTTLDVIVELLK